MKLRAQPPAKQIKRPKQREFLDSLRDTPQMWAKLPLDGLSPSSINPTSSHIKYGRTYGTKPGEFDSVVRSGEIWVCYLGDEDDEQ